MGSYLKQDKVITGGDININSSPSTGTSFLDQFFSKTISGLEDKAKKEKEQVEYYKTLREAGYSPEEATSRVKKLNNGTFLEKILNRNRKGFEAPSDTTSDPFSSKQEKEKAETRLTNAQAYYYEEGGPRRSVIDKFTPAQLRGYRNDLLDPMKNPDGYGSEETRAEVAQIDQKLKKLAGLDTGEASTESTGIKLPDPGKYQEGTVLVHQRTQKRFTLKNGKWTNA